ncbi:MAG: hypothetical protein J1E41_00010 [Ruminococcus sp.]|nr:hypothetical protein [Ruminococcus sp.]
MDNIQDKIAEIMADPEALSQVQSLGKMLGISPQENAPMPEPTQNDSTLSDDAIGSIAKIVPLLSQVNREDDTTRLLSALRPFLSEEKCRKLDSAKKMLGLMKILPVLKNEGILNLI